MLSRQHGELKWQRGQQPRGGGWLTMRRRHHRSRAALTGQADKTQRLVWRGEPEISCKPLKLRLSTAGWTCRKPMSKHALPVRLFGVTQLVSDEDKVLRN